VKTYSDKMFGRETILEQVIAHTPIIKPDGCEAGYIVIRETDTHYIVHNVQVDENGAFVSRFWGAYFDKNKPNALKDAMERFVEKIVSWHNLNNIRKYD
jgi:hypothetical protein